jgi:hypothetical protein
VMVLWHDGAPALEESAMSERVFVAESSRSDRSTKTWARLIGGFLAVVGGVWVASVATGILPFLRVLGLSLESVPRESYVLLVVGVTMSGVGSWLAVGPDSHARVRQALMASASVVGVVVVGLSTLTLASLFIYWQRVGVADGLDGEAWVHVVNPLLGSALGAGGLYGLNRLRQ